LRGRSAQDSGAAPGGADVATDLGNTPTGAGGSDSLGETGGVGGLGGPIATGGTTSSALAGAPGASGGAPGGVGGSAGTTSTTILRGIFLATGNMVMSRMQHTATLLPSGEVLVVGGLTSASNLRGAELYDPNARAFSATGSAVVARYGHTATLMPSGRVLITGGADVNNFRYAAPSTEIYDPATEKFAASGTMTAARAFHTASWLPNGKLLITGGENSKGVLASAELFDAETGTFTATGSMAVARTWHTATTLEDGKVLIAGGIADGSDPFASAELYDPATGKFTTVPTLMMVSRYYHTATLLQNGNVLVVGGATNDPGSLESAELYDPAAGTFALTGSMAYTRLGHTATLLPTGKVLIAGGYGRYGNKNGWLASAELYDPIDGTFASTGDMTAVREWHTATLLTTGNVLVAGGEKGYVDPVTSAETYE
jgi:hypothetical protein